MGLLCNAAEILPLNPPILPFPPSLHKIHLFSISATKPTISLILKPHLPALTFRRCKTRVSAAGPAHDGSTSSSAAAAASLEIDMVRNGEGVYTPRQKKVVILWDLDNKPPRGPPYAAATALRRVAQLFGDVVEISAYANHHAFVHLPNWVLEERRERRHLDALERKGLATAPSEPYACGVCGRKCRTYADLRRHFKQLHERERQKKLSRMRSLKGKKRQRYKERFISGNQKYEEAARVLLKPKVGYGLASELRRAGVFVKTVEDKPQAADWALKRQMQHSMSRGVDWLFLVSDDSDFGEMLRRAREANLGTVVVGDRDRALGRNADFWVPWIEVENGEIGEKDLRRWRNGGGEFFDEDDGLFSVSHFDGGIDGEGSLDGVVNELAAMRTEISNLRISSFSEGEEKEGDFHHITGALSWDSDTEESWEEDMDGFDL